MKVYRILTYEGPKFWIDETLELGYVPAHGQLVCEDGQTITSQLVTDFKLVDDVSEALKHETRDRRIPKSQIPRQSRGTEERKPDNGKS